jgi:hypothetical protein
MHTVIHLSTPRRVRAGLPALLLFALLAAAVAAVAAQLPEIRRYLKMESM